MAKQTSILEDPRYPAFVERYATDPLRFAIECTGLEPSADQLDLLTKIYEPTARVSVVSGTGTGKTFAFARIALWHLLCFPGATYDGKLEVGSNTYIGAPNIQQVADGVWKEMEDTKIAIMQSKNSWIAEYIEITKTKVSIKGFSSQWFISQIAFQKGKSVGIAGKHRFWQLIIIDEAAGVSDEHFKVITGTQTQGGNRILMASQGVRNAGYFYDTHHSLSKKNGGAWDALCFNSEKSPFVTLDWLKERELESGGRNSVEYQIRVLGRFVEDSSNYLLTRADLERGFEPRSIIGKDEPYGYLILCDVGMGEYRDDTVIVVARVIGDGDSGDPMPRRVEFVEVPLCSNDRGINDLPGDLREILEKTSNATLLVDAGGMGASVVKTLESHGVPVKRVIWGSPCFKKRLKERFFNQRACAMVRLRDALRSGRVVFPQGLSNRIKQKIIDQGARLPFHWSESGGLRYVMESKKEMAKQGIKSPDIIDAMSFAFLETATYMMADERLSNETTIGNKALDFAREAFADF